MHAEIVRWLGAYLNPRLSFIPHTRKQAAKASRVVSGMKMLGNTRRGLHQTHLRTLYIACVRAIMIYGSTLWWQTSGFTSSQHHLELEQPTRWLPNSRPDFQVRWLLHRLQSKFGFLQRLGKSLWPLRRLSVRQRRLCFDGRGQELQAAEGRLLTQLRWLYC